MAMEAFELCYERILCALCGGDDHRLLWRIYDPERDAVYVRGMRQAIPTPGQIVRCNRCGLVFVNPRLVSRAEWSTYSDSDEDTYFAATRAARAVANEGLLADLEQQLGQPGRLLDVGCGDGLLMIQAHASGWRVSGVEIRARLAQRLRDQGMGQQIHHCSLEDASFADASFDVVTLINVLEHVRDPRGMLAECKRIVRPGGLVAVHVPNVGGLQARLRGGRWKHYEPLEHLFYFDRRTLGAFFERCSLRVLAPFVLYGSSSVLNSFLAIGHAIGLSWGNSVGLLARRDEAA
jgi:2-polyprenyl-3-methyl-5-hydroxy-6-metoxy-1,4-benzoquinol methylase